MEKNIIGKKYIIALITVYLIIELLLLLFVIIDIQGIIRISLEALLFFFLYRGKKWAQYLLVSLFIIAIIISILYFLRIVNAMSEISIKGIFTVSLLSLALIYFVFSSVVLLLNKNIQMYIKSYK